MAHSKRSTQHPKRTSALFPIKNPVKVKARSSRIALRAEAIIFGIFATLGFAAGIQFLVEWPYLIRLVLGALPGYAFYKVVASDIDNRHYSAITFMERSMKVHFFKREHIEIQYKDIVGVSYGEGSTPPHITITGNYPMMTMRLSKLENREEYKFIEYLLANGLGS